LSDNSNDLAKALASAEVFQVGQIKEWGEILTDWETANRYRLSLPDGSSFMAGEVSSGFGAFLLRGFLKNKRPFAIEIRDERGALQLVAKRPWAWFFARLEVRAADGRSLGVVQQRFSIFKKRYDLSDPSGQVFATLEGPLLKPWTFHVKGQSGQAWGLIKKKWSGLLKEAFSDADNFGVQLSDALSVEQRFVCLGATFLIDFVHFEDRS